ncbi:MAG: hypothetical protein KDD44_07955, partial [Bdellovibrionales bacterium]|nr:hypothetical protein [Bdellovibrionales bacterium]
MNATDSKTDATSRAVRRLRTTLLAFSVALAVPFFLLFAKAYEQLEAEAFLTHRLRAETLVEQVNERAQTLLDLEDNRPVEHYNFFIVERNQLLKNSALTTSPLAQFPPQSSIPGLVGYFQITPDGKFETPTVPDFDAADDPRIIQAALSPDELQRRIKHRDMLRQLLIPKKVVQTAADQFFSDVSRPAPQAARALGKQAFNPAAEQMLEAPQAPQALVDALRDSEQTKKTAAAGLSYEKLEQLNIDTRPFQKGAAESASLNALSSKISPIQDAL